MLTAEIFIGCEQKLHCERRFQLHHCPVVRLQPNGETTRGAIIAIYKMPSDKILVE